MAKNEKSVEARKEKAAPAPAQPEEWRQLRTLRNEIDRLFDDFGGRFPRWPFSQGDFAASLANGVLTVTVPKSVEAKQKERKIEVKAA